MHCLAWDFTRLPSSGGALHQRRLPFSEASEVINKRIVQAVVGQMETKAALDAAAVEVQAMLTERGYYK